MLNRCLAIIFLSLLFVICEGQEPDAPSKFLTLVKTADSLFGSGVRNTDTTCRFKTNDSLTISKYLSRPTGWTNDYECLFTLSEIAELDSILRAFEHETSYEIAIVTIDSSWTSEGDFDNLIIVLHNRWGVGKKTFNTGIVFGLSATLRNMRISNGVGLEGQLSDLETKQIIDEIAIPEFRMKRYFEGTKKGILAIIQKLR